MSSRASLWAMLGVLATLGCSVPFSDDLRYSCGSDRDCGGDGFVCVADKQGVRSCCHPTGPEVCGDGIDNDCNGLVDRDDTWPEETCNGVDDNCNGLVDETFYFEFDDTNCGSCGRVCASHTCVKWQCVP